RPASTSPTTPATTPATSRPHSAHATDTQPVNAPRDTANLASPPPKPPATARTNSGNPHRMAPTATDHHEPRDTATATPTTTAVTTARTAAWRVAMRV